MLDLLDVIGQWPLLEGNDWDESKWDWEKSILKFRKYISKKDDNIFGTSKELTNEIDTVRTLETTDQNLFLLQFSSILFFRVCENLAMTKKTTLVLKKV